MCEALFKTHTTFLSLAHSPALATAFVAMVQDHYNNLKEEGDEGDEGHAEDSGRHAAGPASDIEADDEGASHVVRDPKP